MANDEEHSLSRLCILLTLSLIRYTFDPTSTDEINFQQYWLLLINVCVFYNDLCAIAWNIIIWIQWYTLELDFKHLIYVFGALNITWNVATHRERKSERQRERKERKIHDSYINTTAIVALILAMVFSSFKCLPKFYFYMSIFWWTQTLSITLVSCNLFFCSQCVIYIDLHKSVQARQMSLIIVQVYAIEKLW